ncbi:MAG: hypothetical protein DRI90_11430 [Deltaproteobacteria bacterium]|nr:MAG: hypothetical protein DRI90_11430 [Deltaproteobacteria bacterium]
MMRDYRFAVLAIATVALASGYLASGCATQADTSDSSSGSSGTGGQGGMTSSGGGGTTSSGVGGDGGSSSPCAVDCSQIEAPVCQVAQCNEQTGQCEVVADTDGTSCDDGVFCTVDDGCASGLCVGGPDNDCGMAPAECEEVVCDEQNTTCSTQGLANGTVCTAADLCLESTTCTNGGCTGTAKDCFFSPVPDDCHVSECNPQNGQCEPVIGNEGGACTDANDLCTVNKTCAAGVCQGGSPMDCSQLTQGCVMGVCDTNNGQCTTQTVGQGQPCDDLDACTTGETCNNGVCGGGTAVITCSQTGDGCCPSNCTASNDYDCNCPGTFVNGTCVYMADTNSLTLSAAQTTCQSLGTGWGICSATILCDPLTLTYIGGAGCDCNGGPTTCACGSTNNMYVHTGGTMSHYVRTALVPNCDWGGDACTVSTSETCGAALCCK